MIKVGSWNIEGRLNPYTKKGRGSPQHILQSITKLNVDVLVLLEAYGKEYNIDPSIEASLIEQGYFILDVEYQEGGDIRENAALGNPYMRILSKLAIESYEIVRLGDLRNAVVFEVTDPEAQENIRVIGVHLDDRSEDLRQKQLGDLIPLVNSSELPTIMTGDYNAMHASTRRAKFIRSKVYTALKTLVLSRDARYLLDRISDMALGTVLGSLESETGLKDADPLKRPTTTPKIRGQEYFPSIRLIDIDHMMTSEKIHIEDFEIGAHDVGSDHRPITAYASVIDR